MQGLALTALPGRYAIGRLPADAAFPAWLPTRGFVACTRTLHELSVVCEEDALPATVTATRGWRALGVDGPLAFELVGVLASLSGALAAAAVSVFVVSTYDTDYLLVREAQFEAAVAALRGAGHTVRV